MKKHALSSLKLVQRIFFLKFELFEKFRYIRTAYLGKLCLIMIRNKSISYELQDVRRLFLCTLYKALITQVMDITDTPCVNCLFKI